MNPMKQMVLQAILAGASEEGVVRTYPVADTADGKIEIKVVPAPEKFSKDLSLVLFVFSGIIVQYFPVRLTDSEKFASELIDGYKRDFDEHGNRRTGSEGHSVNTDALRDMIVSAEDVFKMNERSSREESNSHMH